MDMLLEYAVERSDQCLNQAASKLDERHGEGFSAQHPQVVVQLSMLYVLNVLHAAIVRGGQHG